MPRRIKLTIEYDGTDFKGWQTQSGLQPGEAAPNAVRTVQGTIEAAFKSAIGLPVRIAGASRTDTGVHALGQVASFLLPDEIMLPTEQICRALNGNMQKDCTAVSAEEVPLDFHACRDAVGKIYSYSLFSRYERPACLRHTHWHVRFDLDLEKMRAAASALIGTHDFTSFATRLVETQALRLEAGKKPLETVRQIRRIDILADPQIPGRVVLRIEGGGFLYQMVRTIAGSLVDVGRDFRPVEWMAQALAAKDRRQAGPTAPPHGLCLERVLY